MRRRMHVYRPNEEPLIVDRTVVRDAVLVAIGVWIALGVLIAAAAR